MLNKSLTLTLLFGSNSAVKVDYLAQESKALSQTSTGTAGQANSGECPFGFGKSKKLAEVEVKDYNYASEVFGLTQDEDSIYLTKETYE